jgi:hypothetical protein
MPGIISLVGFRARSAVRIRRVLEGAGYTTHVHEPTPLGRLDLASVPPTAILIEAGAAPGHRPVLEWLRASPGLAGVPIIVLGRVEREQEGGGGVHAVLPLHVGAEDLLRAIESATRTTSSGPAGASRAEVAPRLRGWVEILLHAEMYLMAAWRRRVRAHGSFAQRGDVTAGTAADPVAEILHRLLLLARRASTGEQATLDEDLRRRIHQHGATRRRQGVPVEGVLAEYQILRDVLTRRLRGIVQVETLLAATDWLGLALDDAARAAVAAHVDAGRDEDGEPA